MQDLWEVKDRDIQSAGDWLLNLDRNRDSIEEVSFF